MTKNILKNDVVHHLKSIMLAKRGLPLPAVGLYCLFDVSHPLIDSPTSLIRMFLPKRQCKPIKLHLKLVGGF